jgi:hypothetical protein
MSPLTPGNAVSPVNMDSSFRVRDYTGVDPHIAGTASELLVIWSGTSGMVDAPILSLSGVSSV